MPSRHLALCHLKVLTLRVALLEASAGRDDELDGSAIWKKLYLNLGVDAEAHLPPNDRDGTRLDTFLKSTVGDNAPPRIPADDPAGAPISRLQHIIANIDCDVCASEARGRPCCGSYEQDTQVVAAAGHCIRPIKAALTEVVGFAAALYRSAGARYEVDTELVTALVRPKPLAGIALTVTGKAVWDDDGPVRRAQVWLNVDARNIDRAGMEMLRYVFAHETICHAYQLADGDARDGEPSELCAFAEGWMDYVTALIVSRDPLSKTAVPWTGQDGSAAMKVHHLRRSESAKIRNGARAAEQVLKLFLGHADGPPGRHPWDDFVVLSCQLNVTPLWAEERRSAVTTSLARRLGADGTAPVDADLAETLLKWRVTRDRAPEAALASVVAALQRPG